MKVFYSPSLNGFLLEETASNYKSDDLVEVSMEVYEEFISGKNDKIMKAGVDGPRWEEMPVPDKDELALIAKDKVDILIYQAVDYINKKQFQGKAAIGKLTIKEKEEYSKLIDYLNDLYSFDFSTKSEYIFPDVPF